MLGRSDKRIGCLIVCGFSAEIQKLNPLIEYLKQQKYIVCCTAIAGQNIPLYRANYANCLNWKHSIEETLKNFSKNCDVLIVIGFSIGSLITFHLARKYSIDALIVVNAPVYYSDYKKLLKGWLDNFYARNSMNTYDLLIGSKIVSLRIGYNLKKMAYQLKSQISEIRCPILIIQGKKDNMVKWTGAYVLYENIPAVQKEIQFFPKSGHGICMDCECKLVCIRIHQFIERIVGDKLIIQSTANKY